MAEEPIDYEALPYGSMPFPQSQPSHLAALAALHGHAAPPIETARVLELGCASGGNLIPLAARFPDAVFEGVDLSPRHAKEGMAIVRELGLRNIVISQGDIAALELPPQHFDYIICHGVFSWVPRAVQEAIFHLCANSLSDAGIAYVSYNVLPGWHLQLIVREMCRRYAASSGSPQSQIARARSVLAQLAQLSDDKSAFGKVLREEVQRSTRMSDSHFMGEFLGADNHPCHFHEFVARSEAQGLAHLCDAVLGDGRPESLGPQRVDVVRQVAGDGPLAAEQCMDFVSGRTLRRSLLVKGKGSGEQTLRPDALTQLHLCCPLVAQPGSDGSFVFSREQSQLKTNDPALGATLQVLAAAYPETRSFAQVVAEVAGQTSLPPADFRSRLSDALLRIVVSGQLIVSSHPVRVGSVDAERPALWPLARAQLRMGQTWVSNLLHLPIQLPPAARAVAGLFDGVQTDSQIVARLLAGVRSGQLVIDGLKPLDAEPAAQAQAAQRVLRSILSDFRRGALLSPSS